MKLTLKQKQPPTPPAITYSDLSPGDVFVWSNGDGLESSFGKLTKGIKICKNTFLRMDNSNSPMHIQDVYGLGNHLVIKIKIDEIVFAEV